MEKILIMNGPNLNLLGKREPEVYGKQAFKTFFDSLQTKFPELELHYFQSNHEGGLIDKLHEVGFEGYGVVLNAGGYTHTSVALADAVKAITAPVIEVHISNVHAREAFRQHSYLSAYCQGTLFGFGLLGYELAITALRQMDN